MKGWSVEALERLRRKAETAEPPEPPRRPKYSNRKTGGYDSAREYRRAQQLRLLLEAGEISDLREQVRYLLVPARRNAAGYLERAVHYVADFVYTDRRTGLTVVEDTKGVRTPAYVIKRKLMLAVHSITIVEI